MREAQPSRQSGSKPVGDTESPMRGDEQRPTILLPSRAEWVFPILASKRHDDDRPQLTTSQLHGNRAVQPLLNAGAEPGPTGTKDETSSVDGVG